MSAAAPNPNNLILLGLLGIGAYWLFSKQAMARPAMQTAQRPMQPQAGSTDKLNGAANLLNSVGRLFGGANPIVNLRTDYYTGRLSTSQYNAAANAARSDSDPDLNGSVSDWVGNDGISYNPPGNQSVWDSIYLG